MDQKTINNNYLSQQKFLIVIERFPNVNFFAQRCNLPGLSVGKPIVPTNRAHDYPTIGDKVIYEDLIVGLIVDEDLQAIKEITDWILEAVKKGVPLYSDLTIQTLTNNSQSNKKILYKNAFPYMISGGMFDVSAEDNQAITADITFTFSDFKILNNEA